MPVSRPSDSERFTLAAAIALVIAAAVARVAPHPWNFTPLVAIALFSGAKIARASWAGALILVALALGDLALGLFPYEGMGWVYGSALLVVAAGRFLRKRPGIAPTLLAALTGGALFYVVTNFGVWAAGNLYPRTASGLLECYVAAVPFYRNQVAGDLVYTVGLFGAFAVASRVRDRMHPKPAA
jgi:hypothetical protein